jgi:hypothetical protein
VKDEVWEGPFRLRDYLDRPRGWPEDRLPPEAPGLYVATAERWSGRPPQEPPSLCAGKTHAKKSGGLRSRIDALISAICGFHGDFAGRHAEGITISREYCRNLGHNPLDIYVAWRRMPEVSEDQLNEEENGLIKRLQPIYNVLKKGKCSRCPHSGKQHWRAGAPGRCEASGCHCLSFGRLHAASAMA